MIKSISPSPESVLSESSEMTVTLEYSLKNYDPGKMFLLAQFDKYEQGYSTDGSFPSDQYPIACGERGVVDLRFPMRFIWNLDSVKRPFEVSFLLNRETSGGKSKALAWTPKTIFLDH